MKPRHLALAALCGLGLAATPRAARADTVAFTTTGGTALTGSQYAGYSFGYTFTLAGTTLITQLGYYDRGGDGLGNATPVGIYNATGIRLASATVPTGTSSGEIDGYLYVTLATPVSLSAGTYTILGYDPANEGVRYNLMTIAPAVGVTYGAPRSGGGSSYVTGNSAGFANGYFGVNFQFNNAVPEPSTWAAVAVGAAGLGLVLRRRAGRA